MISFDQIIQQKKLLFSIILFSIMMGSIIGILVLPSLFYDQFIWKYFWGPIVSDALSQPVVHNGVAAAQKFTLVSEIVYGVLVVVVLYGLLYLLKKYKISIDTQFFIAILPYVIYGSVVRVLEDAAFFSEPAVYWFVTPLVYFQTLFLFILIFFIGMFFSKILQSEKVTPLRVVFFGGLFLLIPFVFVMGSWMLGNQWSHSNGVRSDIFLVVMGIISCIVVGVYGMGRWGSKRYPWLSAYTVLINLSLIFGHMLDGIASWISIYDPFNMGLPSYIEKHPASDMLMQLWPPLFPIVKFLLIVFIIYFFDVMYKKDFEEYPRLLPLLKIGIFILGFAPGLRDLLRVCMGV